MQPIQFPILYLLPVIVISDVAILQVLRKFEGHVLALLEINLERTLDSTSHSIENVGSPVKLFIRLGDLKLARRRST